MDRQETRNCWIVSKTLQNWTNTNLFYNEWDQGCICWTYNTIPGKYTLPLHGRLLIQVHLKNCLNLPQPWIPEKCSIDLIPKNIKNSEFLSIQYSKPLREYRKLKFKYGDRYRISNYDLPFRNGWKPQFTKEVLEIVAISSRKPPTYTIKMKEMTVTAVNFMRKIWSNSFNNGIVYKKVGFICICATFSTQKFELFHELLTRATESGRPMGGCNFANILAINVPKCHGGKIYVFWQKTFKVIRFHFLEPGLYSSNTDIVEVMNTLIKERHNHNENCITVRVYRRTQKVDTYLSNEESGLAFSSTDPGHIFRSNVGNEIGLMLRGKGPQKPELAYNNIHIHSFMLYTDLIKYNIIGNTKTPLLRCFPFFSKLKAGDVITTGQYINYQTFSNLQFKPLPKTFHSSHIDLRDMSREKIPFVSVDITRFVLMFREASKIHF